MQYNSTERIGVNAVEETFLKYGWIPRGILQTDVGIDMIVEVCENGNPMGKIIAIQIKTGESYFKERINDIYVYRSDKKHVDYWLDYALPVIVILHSIGEKLTVWQVVNKNTVENTPKGYKIKIPVSNTLNEKSIDRLKKLTETPLLLNKFQKLLIDKPIIDLLKSGKKVVVELDKWVNNTSERADIRVFRVLQDKYPDDNKELKQELIASFSIPGINNYQSLYHFYPWANFEIDRVFYEFYSDYSDDDMPGYKIVFIEDRFHDYPLSIIPYDRNDELNRYRIKMSLNEFGNTFLDFYDFIVGEKQLKLNFE